MNTLKYLIPLITSIVLVGCGSSSTPETSADKAKAKVKVPVVTEAPAAPALSLSFTATKSFHFTWVAVTGATFYNLKEAATDGAGYSHVKKTEAISFDHVVPLYGRLNAKYILQSCNAVGCTDSAEVFTSTRVAEMVDSIGYFKASNTGIDDNFGFSVSLSADGNTLAVGAPYEDSDSQEINAGETINTTESTGAVYVFTRSGVTWIQEAYIKANNANRNDDFGQSVSLSDDGNTLAVGAPGEANNGAGATDNSAQDAGAAYVFIRLDAGSGTQWSQQAYVKASNVDQEDQFGHSVSLSDDGNTLAVGAPQEDNIATAVDDGSNGLSATGAVYVFTRSNAVWSEPAYLKASNSGEDDYFGFSVSLNADGSTLAVGAPYENSNSQQIDMGEGNDSTNNAGAAYVFTLNNTTWSQQAYIKADNADQLDLFGSIVSISADGNTLAVGAPYEDSNATGINGNKGNDNAVNSGAAYVFTRNANEAWAQAAYLKASNTGEGDQFGRSLSISADGHTLAVGARLEDSDATGIDGTEDIMLATSGAVYTFAHSSDAWSAQAYIKASDTGLGDEFGYSTALSADGGTLAVGAWHKDHPQLSDSGAVYLY